MSLTRPTATLCPHPPLSDGDRLARWYVRADVLGVAGIDGIAHLKPILEAEAAVLAAKEKEKELERARVTAMREAEKAVRKAAREAEKAEKVAIRDAERAEKKKALAEKLAKGGGGAKKAPKKAPTPAPAAPKAKGKGKAKAKAALSPKAGEAGAMLAFVKKSPAKSGAMPPAAKKLRLPAVDAVVPPTLHEDMGVAMDGMMGVGAPLAASAEAPTTASEQKKRKRIAPTLLPGGASAAPAAPAAPATQKKQKRIAPTLLQPVASPTQSDVVVIED